MYIENNLDKKKINLCVIVQDLLHYSIACDRRHYMV